MFEEERRRYFHLNDSGVTLVELLIVIGIIGILAVALGFSYVGWQGGYKVENEIRTLYAALLDARSRALQYNRVYFFDISSDGRFYRITQDDSDGLSKPSGSPGDGIFQAQATWAAIQASNPVSWGATAVTTDTMETSLSHKTALTTKTGSLAGLFSARNAAPYSTTTTNNFVLGFDKRGIIKNMIGQTNIQNAAAFPSTYGLSICIFTDYDNNGTSDYNPDFDCINIRDTKITLGKLDTQNTTTPAGLCEASNCKSR